MILVKTNELHFFFLGLNVILDMYFFSKQYQSNKHNVALLPF